MQSSESSLRINTRIQSNILHQALYISIGIAHFTALLWTVLSLARRSVHPSARHFRTLKLLAYCSAPKQDARRKRSHALAVNQPNAEPAQIYRSTAFDSFSFKPNSIQSTTMMNVVPAEEESEAEVRREDQDNINNFARLNARLHELRDERDLLKKSLERLDDASTELMMASGDKVMLLIGESFFDTTEDLATEYCEEEVERMQGLLDKLSEEEDTIVEKQVVLKERLYGRFGKSIQLEEK